MKTFLLTKKWDGRKTILSYQIHFLNSLPTLKNNNFYFSNLQDTYSHEANALSTVRWSNSLYLTGKWTQKTTICVSFISYLAGLWVNNQGRGLSSYASLNNGEKNSKGMALCNSSSPKKTPSNTPDPLSLGQCTISKSTILMYKHNVWISTSADKNTARFFSS